MRTNTIRRLFPFLNWPRPTRALMTGEIWAGITVGMMVIPQGVAYAALAGMPLITGMYASLLPLLVAVMWSSSARLSVGPTALSALLIGTSLAGQAAPGSPEWVALAVWLAFLSGLLQFGLGLGKFGWLLNLVSSPVLTGFTQAAAILILLSQLPGLIGVSSLTNSSALLQPNLWEAGFGLAGLAVLILGKRWFPRFPTLMALVVVSALLSAGVGFASHGGKVVGSLPQGLPSFYWPGWLSWEQFTHLALPTLVITLISFLETASSAKIDNQKAGTRWNENQDLIGQGLGKLASGFSGAFATSSSFSRSAITLYAGAKTQWSAVVAFLLVLVVLLWLTPGLYHVPQSILSAVVVVAVLSLIQPKVFLQLWRISRVEGAIALTTFGLTLLTAPRLYWGVLAGLLLSLSHFLMQRLHPRIIEVGLHPDGSLRDRHLWSLPPLAPHLYALRMDAALDFASARSFERNVAEALDAAPGTQHVCLFAQPINRIDATGTEVFGQLCTLLASRNITLHISGMKLPVEKVLRRAKLLPAQGSKQTLIRLYRTDAEAIAALQFHPEDFSI
ncbi:SulP family inorganic anion transporter [Variovorax sp. HJSM1_2]|uniref:SulP family inorganic anion transporter n=1 Tax=Variovorax sp. HJSM1_2 TaxID=3366263 RepID=UPI003BE6B54B